MEKNKELTPMMELIEAKITLSADGYKTWSYVILSIDKAIQELQNKKQQIEDAFNDGWINCNGGKYDNGETYYNTKYNNQIK